jgi:hypothetical protein
VSFEVVGSAEQARAAGELVGRFHTAVDGLKHDFAGMRVGVHDTPRHLARLAEAVAVHTGHRLIAEVRPLADAIAPAPPPCPRCRPCPRASATATSSSTTSCSRAASRPTTRARSA